MLGLAKALEDLLEGRVSPQDADPRILTWAEHAIYTRACQVLSHETKDARRADLNTIPETIRPYVEREVNKLWTYRRAHAKG